MKKIIISLVSIACLGSACSKKKVPSAWKFGAQAFTTKNVVMTSSKLGTYITSEDLYAFSLFFYLNTHPPTTQDLPLARQTRTFGTAEISVTDGRNGYWPSVHTTNLLKAREINGKAAYSLAPTWFINVNNPNDSVLIEGNFNEP